MFGPISKRKHEQVIFSMSCDLEATRAERDAYAKRLAVMGASRARSNAALVAANAKRRADAMAKKGGPA